MQLITYPNSILLERCTEVPNEGEGQSKQERVELASTMWKIMYDNNGCGLAAPQVGLSMRMFVWKQERHNQAIWNPVLKCVSGGLDAEESCLSLPKVTVTVQRATSSILLGDGLNGRKLQFIGDALTTRIWQHEIDHLDGKLLIDYMSRAEAVENRDALRTLLKNTVA